MTDIRGLEAWMTTLAEQELPTLNAVVREICELSENEVLHLRVDHRPQSCGLGLPGGLVAPLDRGGFGIHDLIELAQGIFPPQGVIGGIRMVPGNEGQRPCQDDGEGTEQPT
jgi:hypothetical protein